MKQEIFEKMEKYGWNLGDNEFEDFNGVYSVHYDFINDLYDKLGHADTIQQQKEIVKNIDATDLFTMAAFVGDFLRAINDLENKGGGKLWQH